MIVNSVLARTLISAGRAGLATVAAWSSPEGPAGDAGYRLARIVILILPLSVFALFRVGVSSATERRAAQIAAIASR